MSESLETSVVPEVELDEDDVAGLGAIDSLSQYAVFAGQVADMSSRERIYLKALVSGKSELEAAKIAGYPSASAAVRSIRSRVEPSAVNLMAFATAGMTPTKAAKKLVSLMDAKQTKFFASKGVVEDEREVEDNKTQIEATQLYYDLSGLKPASRQKIDMSVSQVPQIPEEVLDMSDDELLLALQRRQLAINSGGG